MKMIQTNFNTILDLLQTFPNEQSCIDYLEKRRWNGNIISPFNSKSKVYSCKGNKYKCKETGKYFNVKTQTMFDNSKIPLQKWFLAIYLVTSHKKGISSLQLSKDIGVTQKTAWFLLQRIRNCFGLNNNDKLTGKVEVDETYVGGKEKNKHKNKKSKNTMGRMSKTKTCVFGMLERDGKVIAKVVKNAGAFTLRTEIHKTIEKGSTIYSDEWNSYNLLEKMGYNHKKINHTEHNFVNGETHTNTIEGFWSLLKRGIIGIYHFTSKKHLQMYVDEFTFRYNTRYKECSERFDILFNNFENILRYKQLIRKF